MNESTPQIYLSVSQAAEQCGISVQGFLKRVPPPPDAILGNVRGWKPATIQAWDAEWSLRRLDRKPQGRP